MDSEHGIARIHTTFYRRHEHLIEITFMMGFNRSRSCVDALEYQCFAAVSWFSLCNEIEHKMNISNEEIFIEIINVQGNSTGTLSISRELLASRRKMYTHSSKSPAKYLSMRRKSYRSHPPQVNLIHSTIAQYSSELRRKVWGGETIDSNECHHLCEFIVTTSMYCKSKFSFHQS